MLLYAIMFPTAYSTYAMSISKIDNVVNFLMHYMCSQFSIANILLSYLYLATKFPMGWCYLQFNLYTQLYAIIGYVFWKGFKCILIIVVKALGKKKPLKKGGAATTTPRPPGAHDVVTRRMLSARRLKINELRVGLLMNFICFFQHFSHCHLLLLV